jgi:hypothetical protein
MVTISATKLYRVANSIGVCPSRFKGGLVLLQSILQALMTLRASA